MAIEDIKYFKKIDDISQYVRDGILAGNIRLVEARKTAAITARRGIEGERIVTKISSNGLTETSDTVKKDENGELGWVVTNPTGEEYIIRNSVFKDSYTVSPNNPSQYVPTAGPVLCYEINDNIEFVKSNRTMKIECGGFLILIAKNNIRGIQGDIFKKTYTPTSKSEEDCFKEVLALFELSEDDIIKSRVDAQEQKNVTGSQPINENKEESENGSETEK